MNYLSGKSMNRREYSVIKKLIFAFFVMLFFISEAQSQSTKLVPRLTDYVDPRIGTKGGGHTFPGVSLPFAMVKLGPDCNRTNSTSGYAVDGNIWGFSHTHLSGAGGGPQYGNVLFGVGTGKVNITDYSSPRKNEQVKVGYYSAELSRFNVKAELTASERTGFHQYTFPKSDSAYILVDLGSILGKDYGYTDERQEVAESGIKIITNKRLEGYTTVTGGWNRGRYTVYFSAEFDTQCISFKTWKDGKVSALSNNTEKGVETGAFFYFKTKDNQSIKLKVGMSFISTDKARQNLQNEISGWNFGGIRQNAVNKWDKYLSSVEIKSDDEKQKITFYTAMYHALLLPTNRTGENPVWSSEPYYDDYCAIWDTFRTTNPLLTLLYPNIETAIIKSLINIYEHEGYMPDARMGNYNGRTQGGSNSDIADAYVKGLKGIDYKKAYQSMIKNAEVPYTKDPQKQGRGGIGDYNKLGYISTDFERSGSRTVEYAANDYAISVMAKSLGMQEDYLKYRLRASNWVNLWRPMHHTNFKGFIMPRYADGRWNDDIKVPGKPAKRFDALSRGSWKDVFYEANSWEYSLYVPHDVKRLIDSCGGKQAFISRLDTFFAKKNYFNINNEPGFLTPVLYNYAGAPYKTAQIIQRLLRTHFKATPDGLPGNDDAGSMSVWFIFHALGFYPNAGQDVYLIATPLFPEVSIRLENGKIFRVLAKNVSAKNLYVKSVILNGKALNNSWFTHSSIKNGGTLEFIMSSIPTDWAVNGILPPSVSDKISN